MGKYSWVIYITLAVFVLILISRSSNNKPHRHRHRRLKVRSNFTFADPKDPHHLHERVAAAAFDPLVAEIERKREDREWEYHYLHTQHPESTHSSPSESAEPEWEDFMNAEDYLNDQERFNVTNRLVLLFPNIDVEPADGYVSESELVLWNLKQSEKEVLHRTQREMEIHDKNKDGFVSLAEYEPPSWVVDSDNKSSENNIGWWKEDHFNASDADGDGQLDVKEFNDFLHPSDSNSTKLLRWLCKEEIRERDADKDGKANFKEFHHGIYYLVKAYNEGVDESSHESSAEAAAQKLFDQLDKDGDGYLSDTELLPVIGKIHPTVHHYAKQQAEYIIHQADADKDGRLSLLEMINNPYVFYSAAFEDDEDEDDDDDYHNEFR